MIVRARPAARSWLVAGLAVAAVTLAGCGGDGPTEPTNQVASIRIDVDPSVTIVNGTPTISVGDSADFDATARNGQGQTISTSISWSSLNPSIATVDDTGTAAGLAPGQASIIASAGNGVSDTATLVVQDPGGNPDSPNLLAVSLDLLPRGVLASGGPVEARAVVENDGQEAGSYRLTVGEGGTVLAGVDRGGLAAGATDTVTVTGLGPFAQGTHELTLRVDTENDITEADETDNVTNARLESRAAGYDIELRFVGVSSTLQSEIREEVDRWSLIVTGDVGDVSVDSLMLDDCFGDENPGFGVRTQPIDDLLILVRTDSIDGPAGTLARAGPCFIRTSSSDPDLPPHPVVGLMEIDAADVDTARSLGILRPVIRHEVAHVLGFGSLWNFQGGAGDTSGPFQLLQDPVSEGGTDPRFVGPFAVDRYRAIGGSDAAVPVEGLPDRPGTTDSHWRESIFDNELMTGFIGTGANPLSTVTIASFADMFYSVDLTRADAFSLPAGGAAVRLFGGDAWDLHGDVIFDGPLFGVDADGRVTRIDRRTLRPPSGSGGER